MKVYGPYTRKDGRKHIILYENGQRTTVSYPKYLMEQYLGRKLTDHETVDHINRDFTDDRIENLQILSRPFHVRIDAKRAALVEITCVLCGAVAFKKAHNLRGNAKQQKAGPFCSKRCAGRYGAEIQNSRQQPLPPQPTVESDYYLPDK